MPRHVLRPPALPRRRDALPQLVDLFLQVVAVGGELGRGGVEVGFERFHASARENIRRPPRETAGMRAPADIAVYDENDQISALVEVRAVPESSAEWAVEIRRDIVETNGFTPRYFLVVARDCAYVWNSAAPSDARPDQTFRTDDLFHHYLQYIR